MQKRIIGQSGPEISPIGIGAMSFAGAYGMAKEEECFAVLDCARELGVTHIDTSNVYGMGASEEIIGRYLAQNAPAAREGFHIATKAGITRQEGKPFDNSAAHLETELDKSLTRMGIEQVDLFYVHRREKERPIEEVTETLVRLMEKGKIAAFGFSEIAPTSLERACAIHPVAAVQSEYSLQTRAPDLGLVQRCATYGTTLVAFSPVGRGILTDSPPDGAKVESLPFLKENPRFSPANLPRNTQITARFRAIAADFGTTAAGLAIAWVLAQGRHIIAIPGTKSAAHLRELAAGADLPWTDELARAVDTALPVGWCHGDRYSAAQWNGPERYY